MTCFEVLSWISFLWCLLRDSQFAQTQKLPQGRCHQKKKSKGIDPTQKIYGPSERVFVKAITMPKQRNYYQWMAICAGSSFLVALFHQTHLQTIRSVNRENLIACKCAIEASATPGLYHSSQVSHSWDSYVAQRRVFHFGSNEIYISKAIHVAVVVVVVVFLRAGRDSKISVMTISLDNLH